MSSRSGDSVIPILSEADMRQRRRQQVKGRVVHPQALQEIRDLLGDSPRRADLLIEYLHLIQDRYQQLSTGHLAALARELRLSQSEVFEVASFYHHFDVVHEDSPVNAQAKRVTIRVCEGLSCELAGSGALLHAIAQRYAGSCLADGTPVRVISTPCVGRCEQAPVAVVGQTAVFAHKANSAAKRSAIPSATPAAAPQQTQITAVCDSVQSILRHGQVPPYQEPEVDYAAYLSKGGYSLLKACMNGQKQVDDLIQILLDSGLRGLGGAGFPAGQKWKIVRNQPAPRLMAVNIDEGEPGTFKDRTYLEKNPHQFLEGMLIAAWAVGAERIFIYLRDEYHAIRHMLSHELEKLNQMPPVENLPAIEMRRGAGAYICGEESAMLESIEGKRGMPRLRPPYVAEQGLFSRPTLVHNMETLYWIPAILGPQHSFNQDSFFSAGRRGRKGLRSFSVSGRVNKPGVHVAPAGITLKELIEEYCDGMLDGHQLYAYLPGGASGGIMPAHLADVPLDFDTLQPYGCFIGSAAIIVLSNQDRAVDAARNLLHFFKHESCGQCTPCRVGTHQMLGLIEEKEWNLPALQALSQVMRDASICGLGQAAPNPVDSILRFFTHELVQSTTPGKIIGSDS